MKQIDFNLDPTPQLRKVSFQDGDCPIANCQSFDTTYLGLYKGYNYWKCNSCKATWKTKSKGK